MSIVITHLTCLHFSWQTKLLPEGKEIKTNVQRARKNYRILQKEASMRFKIVSLKTMITILLTINTCDAFVINPTRIRSGHSDFLHLSIMKAINKYKFEYVTKEKPESKQIMPTKRLASSITAAAFLMCSIIASPWIFEFDYTCWHRPSVVVTMSLAHGMTDEQILVSDVWKEVTQKYVDQSFNGLGEEKWKQKRLDTTKAVQNVDLDNKEYVYGQIRAMLKALGDPYTRFLTPEQFESLAEYAKGTSNGGSIGVQLIVDPELNQVVVVNTTPDSPAQKAGMLPGDVILEVNGIDMSGATAEVVVSACRGDPGSVVQVTVRHSDSKSRSQTFDLKRATLQANHVQASSFVVTSDKTNQQATIGLLKLTAFSQTMVDQLVDGLREISKTLLKAVVVDVRGDAGGFMPAGVDAAKLFLPPNAKVIAEVNKF